MFSDHKWILSTKLTIYWDKPPSRIQQLDEAGFQALMKPVKVLADILLNEEGLRPAGVYTDVGNLKEFAGWMLTRQVAIKRFKNVTGSALTDFCQQMHTWLALRKHKKHCTDDNKTLGSSSIRIKVRALNRLYTYRHRLEDALHNMPLEVLATPSRMEKDGGAAWGSMTLPIPDEAHKELLGVAIDYMREQADDIVASLKKVIKDAELTRIAEGLSSDRDGEGHQDIREESPFKVREALLRFDSGKLTRLHPNSPLSISNLAVEAGVSPETCVACLSPRSELRTTYNGIKRRSGHLISCADLRSLIDRVRNLQIACFVIVATSTGMRLGEILALKPRCLVKKRVRGYEGSLYWLKSLLTKTSPNVSGEVAYWLCGELAAEAVRVLERLHVLMPTILNLRRNPKLQLDDSLFRSYYWNGITLEVRSISESALYLWIKNFIEALNLSVGHIHPHQFRRTFARNVVRWSNAPILALQRHFKHWSLLMTDYYIGVDDQLVQLYLSEQQADSRNRLRQIMAGECGGSGGLISQKRLIQMANNEELPLNFRGEEQAGTIEDLVDEIGEDGVVAFKCGDFTTCLYVPGLAKCGEDGPQAHACHPTECLNSYILVEDVPFYLHSIRQNLFSYSKLRDVDKSGPIGQFFLKRIRRDVVAIQPLVPLYAEKLRGLRNHYDELTEAEKLGDYGKVLNERIERDSATLEFVAGERHV
jgi:integrase